MLPAGAFAVVPIPDNAPSDSCVAVRLRDRGDGVDGSRGEVEGLSAERLGADGALCAGQEIVGDVLQMAAVFVPRAGGGDVVGGTFACERECQ